MPDLRPFKGIRYSSPADLKDLTCPPYDVISPEEQENLHQRHEHNAVRLELARPGEGDEKYRNAGDAFTDWIDRGVLVPDTTECLYVYRQDFEAGERRSVTGVLGALALEPFGIDSGVLPHERTMPGPKEDRMALMRALPVNISPIYAIYRGGGGLAPFLRSLEERPAEARFADDHGILHRLWVIRAPGELEMLQAALRPGPLVIADGHHRYETALAFHEEQGGRPGEHDSIMCFCVDADSEGLVVLPYHRNLKAPGADLTDLLRARFGADFVEAGDHERVLSTSPSDHPMVFVTTEGDLLVEISDEMVVATVGERHPAWRALDVVALHEVVLPRVASDGIELSFSKDAGAVRQNVEHHGWDAGVLLRGVSAADIVDVAGSGERMPQKASYFWPKAVTGLVFHALN